MTRTLSRQDASDAVADLGWRFLVDSLRASIPVGSLAQAAEVATRAVAACGGDADRHLRVDLRPERVVVTLQTLDRAAVTARDVDLAQGLSAAIREVGLRTEPETGACAPRSVQVLEIAIDALDIASIRPFWKAVLGYDDEPGAGGPDGPIVDAVAQAPTIWFQQLDQPRLHRNRIHFDICVPHDEAPSRLAAALAAGGRLVSATSAPTFWILADAEGNEACITTWQGRDP